MVVSFDSHHVEFVVRQRDSANMGDSGTRNSLNVVHHRKLELELEDFEQVN